MNLPRDNPIVRATDPFARPRERTSRWQVLVITGLFIVALAVLYWGRNSLWQWALIPVLSAFLIRMFVLFHDCGHGSLFRSHRANAWIGSVFGYVTGVPFHGWHTEHAWHHRNQGRMDRRGIDRVNSPLTALEARRDRAKATLRARMITPVNIFILGAASLLITRKRLIGFFPFRPKFQWPVPNRRAITRNLHATAAIHAVLQLTFLAVYGWVTWLTVLLPAMFIGAGVGSGLFWIQHNFPRTYHAGADKWSFVDVALLGSSYLALPRPLAWVTAYIGLHHVHHLNPRIPNYRLEEARRSVPALKAVQPLSFDELRACFTRVFWDEAAGKMISLKELEDKTGLIPQADVEALGNASSSFIP
jgi:acyl-lipid omega-6 desaturase (Delta-12 desaturase)